MSALCQEQTSSRSSAFFLRVSKDARYRPKKFRASSGKNQAFSNGDSVVVELANNLLEEMNGLFAVVVPELDRNTHTVNFLSNYFARHHFAKTHDLIGMQRVGEALDAQWRNLLG